MKKLLWIIGYGFFIISFVGCAPLRSIMPPKASTDTIGVISPFPLYSGFRARITVADFDIKATKVTSEIGQDLRSMLTAALTNSNRFSVVEQQAPGAAIQTRESSASDTTPPDKNGAEKEKVKSTDLIITTAITEFNPQASGGREGLGGGGGIGSGILGGLLGISSNKALMSLDIRIIDTSTSRVLAASRVQGQASDIVGISSRGVFGNWGLGTALSAYANTPMEKAIRICIIEAVRYIYQTIPSNYYKY